MNIDLILKDIDDIYTRENFKRLLTFINGFGMFDGNFKFFEVVVADAATDQAIKHGLSFIPLDIIFLSVLGDHNFFFNYQKFDREHIYVSCEGPCRLRFFAGRMSKISGVDQTIFPFVKPNGVTP